jgi:hypothetical protein
MTLAVLILIAAWLACAGLTLALCAAAGRADGPRARARARARADVRAAEPEPALPRVDDPAPLVPAAATQVG